MIDMRVTQNHRIDLVHRHRQRVSVRPLVAPTALDLPAFEQDRIAG